MYDVVGVRFKKAGKIYYFDPGELEIQKDCYVIVETVRGVEFGKVVVERKQVDENDVVLPLKKVIRIADHKDRLIVDENKASATEAYDVCCDKINSASAGYEIG